MRARFASLVGRETFSVRSSSTVVWLKYEVDLRALFMENALGEKAGDVSITRVEGRELGLAPWNRPSPKELWGRSPNEAAVKVSR